MQHSLGHGLCQLRGRGKSTAKKQTEVTWKRKQARGEEKQGRTSTGTGGPWKKQGRRVKSRVKRGKKEQVLQKGYHSPMVTIPH